MDKITEITASALNALYGIDKENPAIQLQKTKKEFEGNLTLVVFPFLKASKKSPEATATEVGEWMVANSDLVSGFNVVKGFLNLSIAGNSWIEQLNAIAKEDKYGFTPVTEESPLVMIEYSSPNTNKPLHLGHVRNNLLGFSLSQILAADGNRVVKTQILHDADLPDVKISDGETEIPAAIELNAIEELFNNIGRFSPAGLGQ